MIGAERFQIIVGLVPLLLLTLGALHLNDCPKEPMVPIYVIVGSSFFLVLQLLGLFGCAECCLCLVVLIFIFLFIWLITGSVYVYGAFKPDFESKHSPEYCEKILYEAAFWCTNLAWVAIVLFGTVAVCRQICLCILREKDADADAEAGESLDPEEKQENPAPSADVDPEVGVAITLKEEEEEEKEKEKENSAPSDKVINVPQATAQDPQTETTETTKLYPDVATVESNTTA